MTRRFVTAGHYRAPTPRSGGGVRHGLRLAAVCGLLAALGFPSPAAAAAANSFGRVAPGTVWIAMAADYKRSSSFVLEEAGTVTSLAGYLDGLGAAPGTQQVRFAVYADEGGEPGALLAQSVVGTIEAGKAAEWVELPLITPLELAPGVYHLAILGGPTGGVARYSRAPSPGRLRYRSESFGDGADATYGIAKADDFEAAIHALLADTEPPTPPADFGRTSETQSSITVSWSASRDDVGVSGYTLYRTGEPVATTSALTYTHEGLECGTAYVLAVVASDDAGNVSPPATVSATTAACPEALKPTCDRVAAPDGSDSAAGTLGAPFRTPQRLAGELAAGQTGCLRAGTYNSSAFYVLDIAKSGIRIRSFPGERATLLGNVLIRNSAAGAALSHLDIKGSGASNTVKLYAPDAIIEDNDITNEWRGRSCMILGSNSGAGQATRVIVRRNVFHECGSLANGNQDHGIYAQNVLDGDIVQNVFWNTAGYAIQLYPNAQGTRVAHNVVDGGSPSVRGGVIFGGDGSHASSNNVVEENVIAFAATFNITSTWSDSTPGTGNIARNNCVWGGTFGNVNTAKGGFVALDNLVADPLFVDRVVRDYRLGTASLCRLLLALGSDP